MRSALPFAACDRRRPAAASRPAVRPLLTALLGFGLAAATGCAAEEVSYYSDAKAVLDARCVTCHTEGSFAPFPLDSFEAAEAVRPLIAQAVSSGSMPPWKPADGCNDYVQDPRLDADELDTLLQWTETGEEGRPEPGTAVQADGQAQGIGAGAFVADVSLRMAEPYTPQLQPDDYRCILVDWPETEEQYVTAFSIEPGERELVHHVIAYVISEDKVDEFEAYEAQDDIPGYTCFGAPTSDGGITAGLGSSVRWLGSWVPGYGPRQFPDNSGVRIDPGSKIVLQMHYNSLVADPAPDSTTMHLALADTVEKPGMVLPFTDPYWVLGLRSMGIPAGAEHTEHSYETSPSEEFLAYLVAPIDLHPGDPFTVYDIGLHMHLLGRTGRLDVLHADGREQCGLNIEDWDFGWQGSYALREPIVVRGDDRFRLTCSWDNSAANQPVVEGQPLESQDVDWGDGTRDEMCLAVTYITR